MAHNAPALILLAIAFLALLVLVAIVFGLLYYRSRPESDFRGESQIDHEHESE